MEYRGCTIRLFCLLAIIYTASGAPTSMQEEIAAMENKRICMDMSTECDKFKNQTYLCDEIELGKTKCRRQCGLCSPADYLPKGNDHTVQSCTLAYSNENVTYPAGMHFTRGCETCTCFGDSWECSLIRCEKFDLPSPTCKWMPPKDPDSCCPVPFCPDDNEIIYPVYWIEH